MNLDLDESETEFRNEVRAFFAHKLPASWSDRVRAGLRLEPAELVAYQKTLASHGWGAPTWPLEFGGTGWTPTQRFIFEFEASQADAPPQFHQGLELIGPIIFTYGSIDQRARYLPRIVSADDWWCQGYSEPGAGSDLASLRTLATRDGNAFVVNGLKTWTSFAHAASHMFLLARTSVQARRQDGISLLLVDMSAPGIKLRRIDSLDESHHINEVHLDDVRVPISDLVGEEGKGWSYGKVLLDRERGVAAGNALRIRQQLRAVRRTVERAALAGAMSAACVAQRIRLAQLEIETIGLEILVMRLIADEAKGRNCGPQASIIKLRWSELTQQAAELWAETLGYHAAAYRGIDGHCAQFPADMPYAVQGALYSRVTSIYGGSSEIQRNIVARRFLGL
jgi:alkylation response protein AidB-like acyl-CoA dehydrogenase